MGSIGAIAGLLTIKLYFSAGLRFSTYKFFVTTKGRESISS